MTNGYMKSFWTINILHKALKCQDVSIQWSLRHLLELFCPRAVTWIQVHFRKIEVEQTKVSQFLPCDGESFPRNIRDYWVYTHYISSSIVLVREHLTFCQSDENVQDQWKTHRKHDKAGFWDKLLHYYILLKRSSPQTKCYPSSKILPQKSMMYAHIAVKSGVAVRAIQAKEDEGKEQAVQGLIIDSFLL